MSSNSKLVNPKIWPSPLGCKAETADLPETVDTAVSAEASHEYLFPHKTELSEENGGCPPGRTEFNALLKTLGDNIYFMQRGGVYQYDATVSYPRHAVIQYQGVPYQSLKGDNRGNTPGMEASAQWWARAAGISSINGVNPDPDGNIDLDLSTKADKDDANEFTGDNAFKGKVSTESVIEFTGKNIPDSDALKDTEYALMGNVREYVQLNAGGTDKGATELVQRVKVITPANKAKNVSVFLEFAGEPFANAFHEDPRLHREIQVTEVTDTKWERVLKWITSSDDLTVNFSERLKPFTEYKLRARDVSEYGREGLWSSQVIFTTGDDVSVETPQIISITGGETNEVTENPEISCSLFSTNTGADRHEWTNWVIRSLPDNAIIYESLEDRANLRTITVPVGTLDEARQYEVNVQYHGKRFGSSAWGSHKFTTAARFTYVAMPSVSVQDGALNVMSRPTFNASTFRLVTTTGAVDTHRSTSWKVESRDSNKHDVIWESLEDREHLRTITMPGQLLEPDSAYRVMVKYHGRTYESAWAEENFITAERFEHVKQPVLTVSGAPDNVPEQPELSGGAFTCLPAGTASDTHASTDWVIYDEAGEREVWASRNDTRNLTSVQVPKSVLATGNTYLFTVTYNGKKYGPSDRAEVTGTTRANFTFIDTPKLTVEGAPSEVRETPLLTGTAFKVISDSGETDTHVSTHWKITKVDTGAVVFETEADTQNLTRLTVPGGVLEPATAYRFQVAYIGKKHGKSAFATVDGTTHTVLAYINVPTLTVQGHPATIGQTPRLSGSPFSVYSDNEATDTHKCTDWQVLSTTGAGAVWEALQSSELTAVTVPAGKLQEGTEYVFRMRYHGTRLAPTEWIEVRGTTMAHFNYVESPEITIDSGATSGPDGVLETPTFTGSAFKSVSSTGVQDTHKTTEWKVVDTENPEPALWTKTVNSTDDEADLLSAKIEAGKLQTGKSYKVMMRYEGEQYGWSAWSEVAFTTKEKFTFIDTPVVSMNGSTTAAGPGPTFNGSAFKVISNAEETDTHASSSWRITVKNGAEVYKLDKDTTKKTSLTVPKGALLAGQTYVCYLTYHGTELGDSATGSIEFKCADVFEGVQQPSLTLEGCEKTAVTCVATFVASDFEFTGGTDEMDKVDWVLYKGEEQVWSETDSTLYKILGGFGRYALQPSTNYVLKYRQHAKTANDWSAYGELAFTTAADLLYPTLKFKMKSKMNLGKMCAWFNTSDFQIKVNGNVNENVLANWQTDQVLSETGAIIEIINTKDPSNYPMMRFAGDDGTLGPNLMSIEAPLPPLRSSDNGGLVTEFGGRGGDGKYSVGDSGGSGGTGTSGTSGQGLRTYNENPKDGYGLFSKCSSLESLPEQLFKYNPQVTSFGGRGGTGGHSNGGNGGNGGNGSRAGSGGYGGNGANGSSSGLGPGKVGYGCFAYCSALTELPGDLFKYNTGLYDLSGTGGAGGRGSSGGYGGNGGNGGDGGSGGTAHIGIMGRPVPGSDGEYGGNGGNGGNGGDGYTGVSGAGGDAYGCFAYCSGLTALPAGLFKFNPELSNLAGVGGAGGEASPANGGYGGYGGDGGYGGSSNDKGNGGNGGNGGYGGNGGRAGSGGSGGSGGNGFGCFYGCTSLTEVPEDIFKFNYKLTSVGLNGRKGSNSTTGRTGSNGRAGSTAGNGSSSGGKGGKGGAGGTGGAGGAVIPGGNPGQSYGCFYGCSKLTVKTRFLAKALTSAANYAGGTAAKGTVYALTATQTANTFTNDASANVNVVLE